MEATFSKELIVRCKEYFLKRCNLKISTEEADQYLESLGRLYAVFAEIDNKDRSVC